MIPNSITVDEINNAKPASLGRKFAAMLYDGFLLLAILLFVDSVPTVIYGEGIPADSHFLKVFNLLVIVLFYTYFWSRSGQTLGMKTWRLIALNERNHVMSTKQSFKRAVLAIPSFLLLGAGLFVQIWDPEKRSLHERMSASKTVHYRPH
jgi:uncharacterized RDD family membrane protein YckC